ncbi:MAG TPA: hypothetical protein ENG74_01730 [Thermoplasmatales archaeon]|nr:hypothetical protein [Thermoplasmatales archaeon]
MARIGLPITSIRVRKKVMDEKSFRRKIKTAQILINVDALSQMIKFFVSKGREEAVCLLRGEIAGEYLVIWNVHLCKNSKGSHATVSINPAEFSEASRDDGYYVVGWAHSHPGFGVFMSSTDQRTQASMQAMFPDAVAAVIDPFHKDGIQIGFFRIEEGKLKRIDFAYLVRR